MKALGRICPGLLLFLGESDSDREIGAGCNASVQIEPTDVAIFADPKCPGSSFGGLAEAERDDSVGLIKKWLVVLDGGCFRRKLKDPGLVLRYSIGESEIIGGDPWASCGPARAGRLIDETCLSCEIVARSNGPGLLTGKSKINSARAEELTGVAGWEFDADLW